MKKRGVDSNLKKNIIIVSFILYFSILSYMTLQSLSPNNSSEGLVTYGPFNISVKITSQDYAPSINIISPINRTYNYNNINIIYTIPNQDFPVDKLWYNLDNNTNISLITNTTINLGEGSHNITFYINNSLGNTYNITNYFTINTSFRYNISYAKFSGNTTNFNSINTKIGFENITNMTLERPVFGEILFLENINISQDDVNLDAFVDIRSNYICVDSVELPFMNKSAILYLYGLNFTDPKIMVDGYDCLPNECNEISYTQGVLTFNVSHFSCYYAVENGTVQGPTTTVTTSGGGGGGSGSGSPTILNPNNLVINPEIINITITQRGFFKGYLALTNKFSKDINVDIDLSGLDDFASFADGSEQTTINIRSGETKDIQIIFSASTGTNPGLYIRKIFLSTEGFIKKVTAFISVDSEKPLFDVLAKINYQNGFAVVNNQLLSEITITNIKNAYTAGPVDVNIEYQILNSTGDVIHSENETRGFEREINYIKKITFTKEPPTGKYVYYVKVDYKGTLASSNIIFNVPKSMLKLQEPLSPISFYLWIIFLIIILIDIVWFLFYKRRKKEKKGERSKENPSNRVFKPYKD